MANRNIELEQKTYDKLKSNVGTFVTFYGAAAGSHRAISFRQQIRRCLPPTVGQSTAGLLLLQTMRRSVLSSRPIPRLAAEELYLGILTRMPTEDEITEVTSYLNSRAADRNVAAQELVWAVLNSAEFRFNQLNCDEA